MSYSEPIDDPWFEATTSRISRVQAGPNDLRNVTAYYPEYALSPMACTMQFQWCDPDTGSSPDCTDLAALNQAWPQTSKIFKREKQRVTLQRLHQALLLMPNFTPLTRYIAGSVLLVNTQNDLREDQWIRELSHMFGTLLKVIQIRNYRYVGGYSSTTDIQPVITPPMPNETWMCDSQLVRREDYQSISVLGLAIICSIGTLIILVNLTLDSLVGWYQKRYKKRKHATLEWELLQAEFLQRRLYKSYGADCSADSVSIATVLENLEERKGKDGKGRSTKSETESNIKDENKTIGNGESIISG